MVRTIAPASMAVRLQARDLCVRYPQVEALREVSLTVKRSEFVALCGPNGAGKTTLLRCLAGILRPSEGAVLLDGKPPWAVRPVERARVVAYVPQHPACPENFTCLEVVLMGRYAHRHRKGRDEEVAHAAMERTGTVHLAHRPFAATSGGERQRVLLSRALAQEADILLLDEPTAHLDLVHQVSTMALLSDLCASGKTVVCALHELNLASLFCSRIVLLREGRVYAQGSRHEVITPATVRDVYGVEAVVVRHPATGDPMVLPPPVGVHGA